MNGDLFVNAERAPGDGGFFVVFESYRRQRFFRFAGWPANDRGKKGRRADLDHHYARLAARKGS